MPRKPQIQLQAESKFPSKDSCQILLLKKASSSGRRLGAALAAGKTLHQRSFWPVCRCTSVPGLHESEENTNEEEEQSFSNPFGLIICFGVVDKDQLVNLLTFEGQGWCEYARNTRNTCVGLFSKQDYIAAVPTCGGSTYSFLLWVSALTWYWPNTRSSSGSKCTNGPETRVEVS